MDVILRLAADTDQDRAACDEWWRTASYSEKMHVWRAIQQHYDDPVMYIVSRFAQLAFAESAIRNK